MFQKILKNKDRILREFPSLTDSFTEVEQIMESTKCKTCKKNNALRKLRRNLQLLIEKSPESELAGEFRITNNVYRNDFMLELPKVRPSCYDCVRKHISQALKKLREVKQGYSTREGFLHFWYAMADLAEATEECLEEDIGLSQRIRRIRLNSLIFYSS